MIKKIIKKLTPRFLLGAYHYSLAFFGALIYGFASKKLIVIGVTGTSGKSTTVDLITRILEQSGEKVASISTLRFKIANKEWPNKLKMTMPGRFTIQKFFKQAKNAKCKYVVLEVSSEGVKQYRHKFIHFDTAVFTNLSPEHIESHGGFEKYRKAKINFFKAVKNKHVINIDDENSKYFLETKAKETFKFGFGDAENAKITESGSLFEVRGVKFQINLLGKFNVYNAICAITVATSYNIPLEICRQALEKAKSIAGRMEIVVDKNPFTAVVDYAHTPEQLEAVYKTLGSNLICVLGSCGGGRDKWKRPVLGELAAKYCKEIIVTNEDPYDEDPETIIDQVLAGAKGKGQKILDRKEAIKIALHLAKPGDTVIITGKGAEPLMCLANGKKIAWSDKEVVRNEMGEFAVKF